MKRGIIILAAMAALSVLQVVAYENNFVSAKDMGLAGSGASNHLDTWVAAHNPAHVAIFDAYPQTYSFKKKFLGRQKEWRLPSVYDEKKGPSTFLTRRSWTAQLFERFPSNYKGDNPKDRLPWMDYREEGDSLYNRQHDDPNSYVGEFPTGLQHRDIVDIVTTKIGVQTWAANHATFRDRNYATPSDSNSGQGFSLLCSPWLWFYPEFDELDYIGNPVLAWFKRSMRDFSFGAYKLERSPIVYGQEWSADETGFSAAYRVDRALSLGLTYGSMDVDYAILTQRSQSLSFFTGGLSYILREIDSRLWLFGISYRGVDNGWGNKLEVSCRYDTLIAPLSWFFSFQDYNFSHADPMLTSIKRQSIGVEYSLPQALWWRASKVVFRTGYSRGDEGLAKFQDNDKRIFGPSSPSYLGLGLGYFDDRIELDFGYAMGLTSASSTNVQPEGSSKEQVGSIELVWKLGHRKSEIERTKQWNTY